jgi:tetratricopeptide (TPR) repeat protein
MISYSTRILIFFTLFISVIPGNLYSQDVNIIPYLKQIENGKADEVRNKLTDLMNENPGSPSIMFLDGVLTENGQQAVVVYQKIVDEYPESKYADAALYRIYSYYYALGLYESANKELSQLMNDYPESPYIKIAKQNQLPLNPEITQEEGEVVLVDTTQQKATELPGEDYNFTIQAGAFSKKENADNLLIEFEKSGIYSEVKEKLVAGTIFHVVYVGRFITENDAMNFSKTINDRFNLSGRVIEIPR